MFQLKDSSSGKFMVVDSSGCFSLGQQKNAIWFSSEIIETEKIALMFVVGKWRKKYVGISCEGTIEILNEEEKNDSHHSTKELKKGIWQFTSHNLVSKIPGKFDGQRLACGEDGILYCCNDYDPLTVVKIMYDPKIPIQTASRYARIVYESYEQIKMTLSDENIIIGSGNTRYCIAIRDGILSIFFRGTDSPTDVIHDLQCLKCDFLNSKVHSGFLHAYNRCRLELRKNLNQRLENFKIHTILYTGHSLGGALAQIVAADIGNDKLLKPKLSNIMKIIVTFGAPAVGNIEFKPVLENSVNAYFHFTHSFDPVPMSTLGISLSHIIQPIDLTSFQIQMQSNFFQDLSTYAPVLLKLGSEVTNSFKSSESPKQAITTIAHKLKKPSLEFAQHKILMQHSMDRYFEHALQYVNLGCPNWKIAIINKCDNSNYFVDNENQVSKDIKLVQQTNWEEYFIKEPLKIIWVELRALVELVKDFNNVDNTTRIEILVAVSCLLYVANPLDLIPDPTPIIGWIDDIAVVRWGVKIIGDKLELYRRNIILRDQEEKIKNNRKKLNGVKKKKENCCLKFSRFLYSLIFKNTRLEEMEKKKKKNENLFISKLYVKSFPFEP